MEEGVTLVQCCERGGADITPEYHDFPVSKHLLFQDVNVQPSTSMQIAIFERKKLSDYRPQKFDYITSEFSLNMHVWAYTHFLQTALRSVRIR